MTQNYSSKIVCVRVFMVACSSSSFLPEVVVPLAHHGGEVRVAAHQRQRLARGHVEVARHLVQAEAAVDAARVGRLVGVFPPEAKRR